MIKSKGITNKHFHNPIIIITDIIAITVTTTTTIIIISIDIFVIISVIAVIVNLSLFPLLGWV